LGYSLFEVIFDIRIERRKQEEEPDEEGIEINTR